MSDWAESASAPMRSSGPSRQTVAALAICVSALFLAVVMAGALTAGASSASVSGVLRYWLGLATAEEIGGREILIIQQIRLPRVVMGALVGASLAVSGAMMQGIFRNPLADPGLAGVSAGAGLGAASMIVLGGSLLAPLTAALGFLALPLAAFLSGLATTVVLYRLSTRQGHTSIATFLLAGIALTALAFAGTGLLVYLSNDQQLRDLSFWQLGSLGGATWEKIATLAVVFALSASMLPFTARGLNALALGEAVAGHMGIPVQLLKKAAIILVAAMTGASVAVSGTIGFVGIVVPHMLRLSIGPDHRFLLPGTALLGAALLVLADAVARTVVAPAELPIGIITAFAGAPFFLWILMRRRGFLEG